MILHPGAIALLVSSLLISGLLIHSAWTGSLILRHWDLSSGTGFQLEMERRTYLVSTVVAYALGLELVSLFLYVQTADNLAPLFTGAMCAAGSLRASSPGYPVLFLKILNFVLAGLWLLMNHADNLGYDYPLIRVKYAFLMVLAPLVIAESVLQALYFLLLEPDVITSCCGSLFGRAGRGLGSDLAALPWLPSAVALYATLGAAVAAGLLFTLGRRRGAGIALSILAGLGLPAGLASIVSFVSPYVYELPAHHCPFCILQAEYGFIGYPMYAALLGGAVSGLGVGLLMPFQRIASLGELLPRMQARLGAFSAGCYGGFMAIVTVRILVSHLRM